MVAVLLCRWSPGRITTYDDASGPLADMVRGWGWVSSVGAPVIVNTAVWGLTAVGSTTQATLTLHPGDGFLIPPRTPHNATDLGPDTGLMLSTYLVETGQPLATFVH